MKTVVALLAARIAATCAFGVPRLATVRRGGTSLNIEEHIAEMIDKELYRLRHLEDFEKEWHKKNNAVLEPSIGSRPFDAIDMGMGFDEEKVAMARDKRLAERNPQKYCLDRCVSTGSCDVWEDMFEMSPEEVLKFCTDCVLSEGEEPCEIPEKMLQFGDEVESEESEVTL